MALATTPHTNDDGPFLSSGIVQFNSENTHGLLLSAGAESASFTVTDGKGGYRLKFYGSDEDDEYAVTSDRVSGRFSVPAYIVEQVMLDAGDLVPPAGEAAEAADQAEAEESTSR